MNFRDTIGSEELIACLQSVLAGRDGRDKECLALFDEVFIRDLGDAGERAVGVFMREHFDSIVGLLQDEEHGVRHLAAFVLGFTGDARSVEPLISLLTNQKDFYDHDYCYWSLRSLGEVALEPLFEIARGDAGERRVQAVQALGHCGAESLPWLRRFAELQALPDGFFSAVYNCGPSALTLVERGLWHANDKQRGDALFAAYCLTGQAFEQGHPVLHELDRDRWGDRMVELLDDSRIASPQLALNVLGYLQVERHLAVVIDSLATADRVDGAFEALGTFHTPLAGIELEKLLDHADLSIACHSAAVILKRSNEESARLERARGVALRAILDLKRDKAWFAAAAQLPTTRPGRELLYATIEDGEKHCRDIAAGVLAQYVFLHGGAIEALTAECSSQVGKVLTAEERRYRSDWERRTLLLPRRV
jgi:hypothetical protein